MEVIYKSNIMRRGLHRRFYKNGIAEILFWKLDPNKHQYITLKKSDYNNGEIVRERSFRFYLWGLQKKYKLHDIHDIAKIVIKERETFELIKMEKLTGKKLIIKSGWEYMIVNNDIYFLGKMEAVE